MSDLFNSLNRLHKTITIDLQPLNPSLFCRIQQSDPDTFLADHPMCTLTIDPDSAYRYKLAYIDDERIEWFCYTDTLTAAMQELFLPSLLKS